MQIHSWSFVLQIASFCPFGTVTTSTTYRCDSLLMIIFECYVCVGCNCMFLLTLGPKGRIVNIFLFQFYLWLTNVPMTFLGIEISWVFIYLFFFFSRLCSGRILGLMVVVVILINTGKITRWLWPTMFSDKKLKSKYGFFVFTIHLFIFPITLYWVLEVKSLNYCLLLI